MDRRLAGMMVVALAAAVTLSAFDADARPRKQRVKRPTAPLSHELVVRRDLDGTPIIMQGSTRSRVRTGDSAGPLRPGEEAVKSGREKQVERPVRVRGSSTYIPPPVPSPSAGPPAPALMQPAPEPYKPPPINTYGDRVTNCIHSYPLNRGIGNNPTDQQAYIRQCAN